jgi:hypothetical protein
MRKRLERARYGASFGQERIEELEARLATEREEVARLKARVKELEAELLANSFLRNPIGRPEKAWANLIVQSGLFDPEWYLATYRDVREDGADPALHYLRHGAGEGRDPSASFSTRDYLADHPELVASGVNPLLHALLDSAKD